MAIVETRGEIGVDCFDNGGLVLIIFLLFYLKGKRNKCFGFLALSHGPCCKKNGKVQRWLQSI